MSLPGKRPGATLTKHGTDDRNLASPFWRSMLAKSEQRCLVPFTRFAVTKVGARREEHWFTVKGREVSAFAGVWRWAAEVGPATKRAQPQDLIAFLEDAAQSKTDDRSLAKVFAFLTYEPNPLVAPLHPKAMPEILAEADYQTWLTADWQEVGKVAVPSPSQLMDAN